MKKLILLVVIAGLLGGRLRHPPFSHVLRSGAPARRVGGRNRAGAEENRIYLSAR